MQDDIYLQSDRFLSNVLRKLRKIGYTDVEKNYDDVLMEWSNIGNVIDSYPKLKYKNMIMNVWADSWEAGGIYYLSSYEGEIDVKFASDLIKCINQVVQETGENVELGIEFSVGKGLK
jgi:hypothetical protein